MGQFNFKSSGKTRAAQKIEQDNTKESPIPITIKTPLRKGQAGEGLFSVHFNLENAIADNLRNLILTNNGDRYMNYSFGANLKPLTTEFMSKDFEQEAMNRIRSAVAKYMPFIELDSFSSKAIHDLEQTTGNIEMIITYSIPILSITDKKLQVNLYVI